LREFENSVLKRIFLFKKEVTRIWRKLHDEELHVLFSSPNIIKVIISRRIRWVGHVACLGEMRNAKFFLQNLKGKYHFEQLGVDRRIVLEWILEK
jgi:hypothetical protein